MTISEPTICARPAATTTFRPLGAGAVVWLCADACLDLRPARTVCSRCRNACPVQAIEWSSTGAHVGAACTGCGRCAAACPSGALHVAGFEAEKLANAERRIECRRVPDRFAGAAARVPCLGGLSTTALVRLARSPGPPWRLVDRGWCPSCPSGGGEAALAAEAIAATALLLAAVGIAPDRHPAVVTEPLPQRVAWMAHGTGGDEAVGRRGFLAALVRNAVAAVEPTAPVTAGRGACKPSPVIALTRTGFAADLHALAQEAGGTVPATVFPTLRVDDACCDHGLCTAVCPSGALRRYADESAGLGGLAFDAQACVACGLCARSCPSEAIRMLPAGNDDAVAASGPRRLTAHPRKTCAQCAAPFAGAATEDLCPRCGTAQALAVSLFGTGVAESTSTEGDSIVSATHPDGGRS